MPACIGSSSLRVAVQPGEYIHVVAGQESRDVILTLFDSGGRKLLRADSLTTPGTAPSPEEIHWVADAPGELRIELTLDSGSRGPCDLRLAERRRATAADRRRALVEADLVRAHEQRLTGKAETCRAGIALYESAERGFADLGVPRRQAEALLGLGLLQTKCLHDEKAALGAFTRARPLFAADSAFEALVRQHLGELLFKRGDFDGAISEDQRALALSEKLDDHDVEIAASGNLGHALHMRGRYDEAAISFDRALALWKPGDDLDKRARVLLNRGHLHRDLGETEQARERFNDALTLFRQVKDRNNEASTLNALGLLALDAEQPDEALALLRDALALCPPASRGRAVLLTGFGVAYRQLGRLEDARRDYAEALEIFRGLGDSREQARSLGNLGRLEATAHNDAAALADFDRALLLFRTLADPSDMDWVVTGKAWVLRRKGDLEGARELMDEALTVIERHRFSQMTYATRADFFSTRQDSYELLIDLLMEMHRKAPAAGYAAAALEVSERSLARSLLDGLAAGGNDLQRGLRGAAPELHDRERELETRIDELVSRETRLAQDLSQETSSAALVRQIEEELSRRWADLDRVRAELRAGDPRYAALTQPQPASAAEIRRDLLDPNTLLLEYKLGEKRSFLWAVTPDSLESFDLPGRAEIEKSARPACELLARSGSPKADGSTRRPLAELSRLLLGPVAALLPGKRLLVVADGILQSLPFAALPEPGTGLNGELMVAHHEIVGLPSASVLGELRREVTGRAPAPKTLWVLADPDFGGRYPRLRGSSKEAAAILGLAPNSFALQGKAASRTAVLHSALHDYHFLHFATHGLFGPADPGGGRLVLAQNGFLHLADIYRLDLRADLVVLSACRSALGRDVRGEGMMGMTRGFFYAGAERVLASLWNVNDDQVTVELMQRFYRGMLIDHLSPAAAFRAAQDAIRSQERWHAPYYWAGFTLQGEWR